MGLFPNSHRRSGSSFQRLRSFHLAPGVEEGTAPRPPPPLRSVFPAPSPNASRTSRSFFPFAKKPEVGQEVSVSRARSRSRTWLVPRNASVPIPPGFIIVFGVILSLLFIVILACTFRGAQAGAPPFKELLDSLAETSPGVVLIGDNVDVDVDEPSVTIRWSIVACGADFMLPGSNGTHGSSLCGLPNMALAIFVDGADAPTALYDPADIPFTKDTGLRRSVQNLVQFDSDHDLDVHKARLYPFDTYFLSSSIRLASPTSNASSAASPSFSPNSSSTPPTQEKPIPIQRLVTLDVVTNFDIDTRDVESYQLESGGGSVPTRDIDMTIRRPAEARTICLLLFGVSWVLTHVSIGHVLLARRLTAAKPVLKHLAAAGAILVALPHIRDSMPDAPGLDGFLIDTIGFFPQMIITGTCIVALLLIVVSRELSNTSDGRIHRPRFSIMPSPPPPPPLPFSGEAKPPSPTVGTSGEMTKYEMDRVMKHLKGQYVFPPLPPVPSSPTRGVHRRVMTVVPQSKHM